MSRAEIRLSGFGGQGVVSAGYIIARAAALYSDGKDAVLTRAYGPEKTGGWARADVVITDGVVDYPLVEVPDVFIAMSQDGFDRDIGSVKSNAMVLVDARLVDAGNLRTTEQGGRGAGEQGEVYLRSSAPPLPDFLAHVIPVPATETAETLGKRVVANIVMLGAFVSITGLLALEAMERAVFETVPDGTEELNVHAFRRGLTLAGTLEWAGNEGIEVRP